MVYMYTNIYSKYMYTSTRAQEKGQIKKQDDVSHPILAMKVRNILRELCT